MKEIKKPKIKSEDPRGKWTELIRFLFEMIDNLNWCLFTLENSINWQKTKLTGAIVDLEETSRSETETELCAAKFKKTGKTVSVILYCYLEDGAPTKGTANLVIPKAFLPTFFDSGIAITKTEEFSCFLGTDKITIDYDFSGETRKSSVYFQYIS